MEANSNDWKLSAALCCGLLWLVGCTERGGVSPREKPPVQVIVVKARRLTVSETLPQVGTITANEMVELKAETEGIVEAVFFEEGQEVEKGKLLLRLNQSKLGSALAETEANFSLSKANFERAQQLFQEQLISRQEFDQIGASYSLNQATVELRKRQFTETSIIAPFKGLVGARNVSPGQVISRNSTLTWLVDDDPVKVEFQVPERFLGQLHLGQAIELVVAAYGDRRFPGEVFFIAPYIDPATRTAMVKARVPNPKHELKAGMFANLELTLQVRENAVVIPEVALSRVLDNGRATVWVVDADLTANEREVTLGIRMPGQIEILKGLSEGEDVVAEGVQKLAPGAKVKLAPAEAAKPYLNTQTLP